MKHHRQGNQIRKLAVLLLFSVSAGAHDPISTKLTWSREISRIVYRRCASCHRPDASAMPLLTYEQARPWAVAISEEVTNRRMPPWGAVKGFGEFRNEEALTQEEIEQLTDWVAGGAPEGDPSYLPPAPAPASALAPPQGRTIRLNGSLTFPAPVTLAAIRPVNLPARASVQVLAFRPDGSVEPLLWIRGFTPRFARQFTLSHPLHLPRGTRIRTVPASAGTFELTISDRS